MNQGVNQISYITVTCEDTMDKCKLFIAASHAAAAVIAPLHIVVVHSLLILRAGLSARNASMNLPSEHPWRCCRNLANTVDEICNLVSASRYRVARD